MNDNRPLGIALSRELGSRAHTALVIGEVIAVGIFLTPAGMARSLASPFWLLVAWLAMGAMTLCGALSYGELAARYPEPGGAWVYPGARTVPLSRFYMDGSACWSWTLGSRPHWRWGSRDTG